MFSYYCHLMFEQSRLYPTISDTLFKKIYLKENETPSKIFVGTMMTKKKMKNST